MKHTPKIIVHGGAWEIPEDEQENHIQGCKHAIEAVYEDLYKGLPAQEAVCRAIEVLEADPTFDAGKGGVLRANGVVELDASIMNGEHGTFASVINVTHYMHPIRIAEALLPLDISVLCCAGAENFAQQLGMQYIENEELIVAREQLRYNTLQDTPGYSLGNAFVPNGTVGAVVLDTQGNIVAGTSTGGVPFAPSGRVGDTPFCGAGTYADNALGGASATGYGEAILRVLLTRTACDLLATQAPMEAVKNAVTILHKKTNGFAGIIALNPHGIYGIYHNTTHMAHAFIDARHSIIARV